MLDVSECIFVVDIEVVKSMSLTNLIFFVLIRQLQTLKV